MSTLLYILVAEVFGIEVRINKIIMCYKYGNNEKKILQYADDNNIFVTEFQSIHKFVYALRIYEASSKTKVNYPKQRES